MLMLSFSNLILSPKGNRFPWFPDSTGARGLAVSINHLLHCNKICLSRRKVECIPGHASIGYANCVHIGMNLDWINNEIKKINNMVRFNLKRTIFTNYFKITNKQQFVWHLTSLLKRKKIVKLIVLRLLFLIAEHCYRIGWELRSMKGLWKTLVKVRKH